MSLLLLLFFIWTMKSIYEKKLTGFTIVVPWNIKCNNSKENELKIRFLGFLKYIFFSADM